MFIQEKHVIIKKYMRKLSYSLVFYLIGNRESWQRLNDKTELVSNWTVRRERGDRAE